MKKRVYLINILLVLFLFLLVLVIDRVSPFGSNIFVYSDGLYQFKPMLYDFIMKLRYGLIEAYSFSNGLGNPTIFNCLYYLTSPINLVGLFFKHPDSMYLAVILVKMAISAFTMTFYVSKKTDRVHVIIISTLSYVFCTWFLCYYYYLTWIDVFMIFPLYHYGLEQIINKKVSYIYIFSLAYMIMTSFYLSFPVCIYTLFYFIIYVFFYKKDKYREKLKSFLRIAIGTTLSLLLSFGILYSLYKFSLKSGVKLEGYSSLYHTNLKGVLRSLVYYQNHFMLEMRGYTFPNLSCVIFILLNFFYYFLNKRNSKRNKIFIFIMAIFIIFTLINPYIDFALNFFHQIRGLTYRYAFIYSFLMILLYVENNKESYVMDDKDKVRWLISFILVIILVALSMQKMEMKEEALFSMIFLACYFITIFINGNTKIDKGLLILIVCLESLLAIHRISVMPIPAESVLDSKYNFYNTTFRYDVVDVPVTSDVLQQNYNFNLYSNQKSTNLLSSMTYAEVIYLITDLQNISFANTTMMLNDKNFISRMIFNEKNDRYNLEKIYAVNKDIKDVKLKKEKRRINEQNIIKAMTKIDIFDKYVFEPETKGNFCRVGPEELGDIKDEFFYNGNYIKDEFLLNKKYCKDKINLYAYNDERIKEAYEYLAKNQIKYTYYTDSKMEGTINVDKDQLIFTSIPYDEDWNIYVDGKKVKPVKLLNSLMGIETSAGKHEIKLEYKEHLLMQFLVSIVTFIGLVLYKVLKKSSNDRL